MTRSFRIIHILISFLFLSLLLDSCANRIPPSGGPKDTAPPVILKTVPENLSTNFTASSVKISFDEYFQIDDPFNQIIISPPLLNQPKFKIRGKNLVVDLNNELEANTTYSINFGDAIRDNNERNTLKNYTYVFSTGAWLDSLEVSGKIYRAENNAAEEDVLALLYRNLTDSAFYSQRPFYFTKTDKNGNFTIRNIGAASYKMFALNDKNLNYLYDSKEEMIGFVQDIIQINDSSNNNYSIPLFKEKTLEVKLLESFSTAPGKYQFVFNQNVASIRLDTRSFKEGDLAELNTGKDTLTYWTSNVEIDSAVFFLAINDSLLDTVEVQSTIIPRDSLLLNQFALSIEKKKKVKGKSQVTSVKKNLFQPVKLNFNRPIKERNFQKIILLEDTTEIAVNGSYSFENEAKTSLLIDYQWVSGKTYKVIFPDSTFKDLIGLYNRRMEYPFDMNSKDRYGSINLNVLNADNQATYLFELYNSNEKKVATETMEGLAVAKITFENYLAGTYSLRIVDDANRNGEWDTGDLKMKIQPEKVIQFSKNLSLRANWEMDLEINLQDN